MKIKVELELEDLLEIMGALECPYMCEDLVQGLVNPSQETLSKIILKHPGLIISVPQPSKKLIQLAIDSDPTLVKYYMADFHTSPKEFKDYIYERLA